VGAEGGDEGRGRDVGDGFAALPKRMHPATIRRGADCVAGLGGSASPGPAQPNRESASVGWRSGRHRSPGHPGFCPVRGSCCAHQVRTKRRDPRTVSRTTTFALSLVDGITHLQAAHEGRLRARRSFTASCWRSVRPCSGFTSQRSPTSSCSASALSSLENCATSDERRPRPL